MKIHIPACIALAMALLSTTAYGQYAQQMHQPVMQQQNWRVPVVQASNMQEPALAVQSNATPAPAMQGAYNSVVGGDCGCASPCGGQCGGRTRLRDRVGGGRNNDCNPCGPERYLAVFGGALNYNDIGFDVNTVDNAGGQNSLSAIIEQNDGWTVGGAIGQRLTQHVRGEVEWSYRNATLDSASLVVNNNNVGMANLDGELNIYRSMSNLLFDLNPNGRINLYFGGGVGMGFIDLDAQEPVTPISARLQGSTFMYQGIVGASRKLNDRVEMFVDYRYTGSDHLEIDAASPIGSLNADVDITSNDIFVGFRFKR